MGCKQTAGKCHVKILLVHNYYGSTAPSGENQVFEAERIMLRSRGHDVTEFTRHSDEIRGQGAWGVMKGALATPWNPWIYGAVKRVVSWFQPDVVHAHNTFPLISPSIFSAIGPRAARVLTLHNYRLFCPAGIPMRAGRVCTDCLDRRSVLPALAHACYRDSRVATVPLAVNVALNRWLGTWRRHVDAFIALSQFQKDRLVAAGLPVDKVHVKPNFYPGRPGVMPWLERPDEAVFVGRLTAEKGVEALLTAWREWARLANEAVPRLCIVGDGPLRQQLERMAEGLPVRFLGQVASDAAQARIAAARLLVLPSQSFEGFPMVVREAFAFGTPAAVSNLGPLPSIVRDGYSGVVFEPGDAGSLLKIVRAAWGHPGMLENLGQGARAEFESKYTEDANYQTLMEIYRQALEVSRAARG